MTEEDKLHSIAIAIFGGGCFWCTEAVFQQLKGVVAVIPGYAGGVTDNPTYEQVCSGKTGHAEVIQIKFRPAETPFLDLLKVFFDSHDPTTINRQGNDVGSQYRSIILFTSDQQREDAEQYIAKIVDKYDSPIVTEIKPLDKFYEAEDEHKNYFKNNPSQAYCQLVINDKVEKVKEKYTDMIKPNKKPDDELSEELYRVARQKGTEAPYSGKYAASKKKGMYKCAVCGAELFSSDTKFDSGSGWPSFTEPANLANIVLKEDLSGGMSRTEVTCKNCQAHLGHVFDDGPQDKEGKRYCINSVCLDLQEES